MTPHIDALLPLVAVSFGVGLAYLALDRFRYTNRIINILENAIRQIEAGLKDGKPEDTDLVIVEARKRL